MPISSQDLETLHFIKTTEDKLKWSHIVASIRIWRKSHNPLTSFFSLRWAHAEGMPTFITELKKLLDLNQPFWERDLWRESDLDADCIKAVEVILEDRWRRNSASTKNSASISSKIAFMLKSVINKSSVIAMEAEATGARGERTSAQTLELLKEIKLTALNYGNHASHHELFSSLIYIHKNLELICSSSAIGRNYYYIPADPGYTQIPIHAENWGSRAVAQKTLIQLVHGVITAYEFAKGSNQVGTFFNKTHGGNCIEGRTRAVLEWLSFKNPLRNVHEVIPEWNQKAEAYLRAHKKEVNAESVAEFLFERLAGTKYELSRSEDGQYFPKGYISSKNKLCAYLIVICSYDSPVLSAPTKR